MKLCADADSCIGHGPCLTNMCANIAGKVLEIRYNGQTLPSFSELIHDTSVLRRYYFLIVIFFACFGLMNNIISLVTFLHDRIRFTVSGVYLIMYALCGLITMALFLINILITFLPNGFFFSQWICHIYPYLFLIFSNTSILMSAAITVENILCRCFCFDRFRSRKCALFVTFNLLIIVSISNLDKIFARHAITNRTDQFYCTFKDYTHRIWLDFNNFISYIYVFTACIIHLICMTFLFIRIQQHKQNWFQNWLLYQDILWPSLLIVLCSAPYAILHYVLYTHDLLSNRFYMHLHTGFILCVHIPQMLTFFIYILPNRYYVKEFQRSFICKKLCCLHAASKQAQVQEFEMKYKTWQQGTALEPVMTISTLNDYYIRGEIYDRIKLEV
ncbi:unnamed protein product [Adineta ricciae]|uniref:G-protein coupled receptors family 1 profile domain-containing protein n=1 Tax=Adineta ricciae TaxID=249248 RepID=A0A815C3D5_ADIRI|nr:unnamed protein product [Adineta ricciae]CAF1281708.1 unnamed protein product [Adineta ricciae]